MYLYYYTLIIYHKLLYLFFLNRSILLCENEFIKKFVRFSYVKLSFRFAKSLNTPDDELERLWLYFHCGVRRVTDSRTRVHWLIYPLVEGSTRAQRSPFSSLWNQTEIREFSLRIIE